MALSVSQLKLNLKQACWCPSPLQWHYCAVWVVLIVGVEMFWCIEFYVCIWNYRWFPLMVFFFSESTVYLPNIFEENLCRISHSSWLSFFEGRTVLRIQKYLWKHVCAKTEVTVEKIFKHLSFNGNEKLLRGSEMVMGRAFFRNCEMTLNHCVERAGPNWNLLRSIKILLLIFIGFRLTSSLFCKIML